MTRVLFLDFDGPLITLRSHLSVKRGGLMQHPDMVVADFLRRVCRSFGVQIVVSSTWRRNEEDCKALLKKAKLITHLHQDWRTPWFDYSEHANPETGKWEVRGREIEDWLKRNGPDVDYLIIDDDSDFLPEQMDRWIKCDGHDGLGGKAMIKILDWADPEWKTAHRPKSILARQLEEQA